MKLKADIDCENVFCSRDLTIFGNAFIHNGNDIAFFRTFMNLCRLP